MRNKRTYQQPRICAAPGCDREFVPRNPRYRTCQADRCKRAYKRQQQAEHNRRHYERERQREERAA